MSPKTILLLCAFVALASVTVADPKDLECGTDATTRLVLGANIMKGPVVQGKSTDGVTVKSNGTSAFVTIPSGPKFAARLMGGGSLTPVDGSVTFNKCPEQVYSDHASAGTYEFIIKGAAAGAVINVGYANGGYNGVSLISVPV